MRNVRDEDTHDFLPMLPFHYDPKVQCHIFFRSFSLQFKLFGKWILIIWADGVVDESEKSLMRSRLEGLGFVRDPAVSHLVEQWLTTKPTMDAIREWYRLFSSVLRRLTPVDRARVVDTLCARLREAVEQKAGTTPQRHTERERLLIEHLMRIVRAPRAERAQ